MALPESPRVRALTERLVAVPSVSPDPAAESAFAERLERELPARIERGRWWTADLRPVVWAFVPGRSAEVTLLLGHHDTVGVGEYARLGAPEGERLAFAPARLREVLMAAHAARAFGAELQRDLEDEARTPGRWMFGRGALDMKSGLAAGIAALSAVAADAPPERGVLFVSCPDEEVESAGMTAAAQALPQWLESRALALHGALNLDFSEGPCAYAGAMGKARALLWVLGAPTHAGAPFAGVDAAQVAAALAAGATESAALADRDGPRHGPPPVVLRLRDLKDQYDVQTAAEALVELNLMTLGRPLDAAMRALRDEVQTAADALAGRMRNLGERLGSRSQWPVHLPVLTLAELRALAGEPAASASGPGDPAALAREELRALARRAALQGPAVVVAMLPPFYPHAAPGDSGFVGAVTHSLASEGIETLPWYPFITDASFVAGDAAERAAAERWTPAVAHAALPPAPLGAGVVNLGPWGRDAHGLGERVDAAWAFGRLPALIERILRLP